MNDYSYLQRVNAFGYPLGTLKQTTSGTSDTYQATGVNVDKLHRFCSAVDCLIEGGTGTSVTASTGTYLKAGSEYWWRPVSGRESLGYETLSGSAFSPADIATVSLHQKTS